MEVRMAHEHFSEDRYPLKRVQPSEFPIKMRHPTAAVLKPSRVGFYFWGRFSDGKRGAANARPDLTIKILLANSHSARDDSNR